MFLLSFGGQRLKAKPGKPVDKRLVEQLDEFGRAALYVLGHNIISHDIPRLRQAAPSLLFLQKPAIDTLFLSPLAYPENPYHRLIKDYQLVRDSVNDPAEDAILAGRVFSEQWQAFREKVDAGSDAPILFRSFLQRDVDCRGTADALGAMGIDLLADKILAEKFCQLAEKHGCRKAIDNIANQLIGGTIDGPPLAYVTAWLTVADGNSVLPSWVRHRFPQVPVFLHQLRESPCDDPSCYYCRQHHNPQYYLNNFFGFDDFRAQPATDDGRSLQEQIVRSSARNTTL